MTGIRYRRFSRLRKEATEFPSVGIEPFLRAVDVYYGDVNVYEPALLKMYDDIIPRLQEMRK